MSWYQGRKVFLTGGSSGIGRAAAIELARRGAHVVVAARGLEGLQGTVREMTVQAAGDAQVLDAVQVDVTDGAAVGEAAARALELLGGIDVVVCNSGYARVGWVHELDESDFERLVQVNYLGHVRTVRAFLPTMLEQGHGQLCLVSSMLALFGMFGYAGYSASKAAIVGFAEGLRHELEPRGIRVQLYYPATTDTPGLALENEHKPAAVWKMESDDFLSRMFTAEEVGADLVRTLPRRRFESMLGWQNWFIWWFTRWFPGTSRVVADQSRRSAVASTESEESGS